VGRVRLEPPSPDRERDFISAALRSRALHRGLVIAAATPADYREYLERTRRGDRAAFLVVTKESDALAGVVEINDVVRASRDAGTLAYYAFTPYAGSGLMREGVALAIDVAFRDLGLERLEANVQPSNRRSMALLKTLGFAREGTVRGYKVGTRWRNHERWVLCA
jgi:ribosomal-protein-alanine N-acetyltransferase